LVGCLRKLQGWNLTSILNEVCIERLPGHSTVTTMPYPRQRQRLAHPIPCSTRCMRGRRRGT
jgi:hypothetical protein